MKFLRCGNKGQEIPAVLDKDGHMRDLSSIISDFDPKNLSLKNLATLKKINLDKLPNILNSVRIGSCISNPGKFVGIGLNYSDHAAEIGAKIP